MNTSTETRRHTRIRLDGQVLLKTPVPGERLRLLRAYLDDISLGGARLYAEDEVDVDQPLDMRVRIPWSGRVVRGIGRVRHARRTRRAGRPRYALGVEFTDMDRTKVRAMIDDKLGGGRTKAARLRQRKREIGLLAALSPLLVLVTWLFISSAFRAQGSLREDEQFTKDFRSGVIRFLYNSE
jgi:hypothetical protein